MFMSKKHTSPLESIKRQYEAYGFTNFVDAAETHRKTLNPESFEHELLAYLLAHGVGLKNAKSWKEIAAHLRKKGFRITKNKFQTQLLQTSRSSLFSIGSSTAGYFLFEKKADIEATVAFYDSRIAKEQSHRIALLFLADRAKFIPRASDSGGEGMEKDNTP
jgi:hypothetical protein